MRTAYFIVVAGLVVTGQSQPRSSATDPFVVVGKDAYLVEPPRQVCDLTVHNFQLLKDGRYAVMSAVDLPRGFIGKAIAQMPNPTAIPRPKWTIWDTSNDKVYPVQFALKEFEGLEIVETAQPGIAFATVVSHDPANTESQPKVRGFRVDLATGALRPVLSLTDDEASKFWQFHLSKTGPFVVVVSTDVDRPVDRAEQKTTVWFQVVDFEGNVLRKGQSTVKGSVFFEGTWSSDGRYLLARRNTAKAPGLPALPEVTVVLDPSKGTIVETTEKIPTDQIAGPDPVLSLELHEHLLQVDKETTRAVKGLWLAAMKPSESTRSLVAANCDGPHVLAPDLSFAAFVSGGRLFRAEITKADYEVFRQAKLAAAKTVALSNVKQIATALHIYAADNNDSFPQGGAFKDAVMPYLKNNGLLDGFVYTFTGGSLNDINDPAGTEIGYIAIAGGRCVAYADGHAKFIKDP